MYKMPWLRRFIACVRNYYIKFTKKKKKNNKNIVQVARRGTSTSEHAGDALYIIPGVAVAAVHRRRVCALPWAHLRDRFCWRANAAAVLRRQSCRTSLVVTPTNEPLVPVVPRLSSRRPRVPFRILPAPTDVQYRSLDRWSTTPRPVSEAKTGGTTNVFGRYGTNRLRADRRRPRWRFSAGPKPPSRSLAFRHRSRSVFVRFRGPVGIGATSAVCRSDTVHRP